jgi:hypothetical protein
VSTIRRSIAAAIWSLAISASLTAPLGAQTNGSPVRYSTLSAFLGGYGRCWWAPATLDDRPNGSTAIQFQNCPDARTGYAIPFVDATLSGGTITNGQIVSATPLTFNFAAMDRQRQPGGFGADFRVVGGNDTILLEFLFGGQSLLRSYGEVGETTRFLGERLDSPLLLIDEVRVSALGGSTFVVDNLNVIAPEPGTWALLGTGLLAVGGVAARRNRTTV